MNYHLRYCDQLIGTISNVESNFPSHRGELTLFPNWEERVDSGARMMIQLELGQIKEDNLSPIELDQLYDVMSINRWTLFDGFEVKNIMVPTFRPGYVSWRFRL